MDIDFDKLDQAIKQAESRHHDKDAWYLPIATIHLAELLLQDATALVRLARLGAIAELECKHIYGAPNADACNSAVIQIQKALALLESPGSDQAQDPHTGQQ